AAALLSMACGRSGDATPSPSPSPAATASPSPVSAVVTSLRDVDFSAPPLVAELIARAGGGEVSADRVLFAQLIAGGPEEAVAIVDSGGTAGEIGAGVYRLVEGRPLLVRFVAYNGRLELNRELIVTREGVFAAGDAECCPSQLHEVTYQWDGSEFAVTTDQVVPNPSR
ncbi:MAG: hypothetical protein WEB13_12510, partial [Dehalococcoidia bacterium]